MIQTADEVDSKIEAGRAERQAARQREEAERRLRESRVEKLISASELAAAPSKSKYCQLAVVWQEFGDLNHTLLATTPSYSDGCSPVSE